MISVKIYETIQFETVFKARLTWDNLTLMCGMHSARSWAESIKKFELMFEIFAVHVIQAWASLQKARMLLLLSLKSVQRRSLKKLGKDGW